MAKSVKFEGNLRFSNIIPRFMVPNKIDFRWVLTIKDLFAIQVHVIVMFEDCLVYKAWLQIGQRSCLIRCNVSYTGKSSDPWHRSEMGDRWPYIVTSKCSPRQVSGTVYRRRTTLITFDIEFTCVIFNRNSVV